jgi:hypothetical protein
MKYIFWPRSKYYGVDEIAVRLRSMGAKNVVVKTAIDMVFADLPHKMLGDIVDIAGYEKDIKRKLLHPQLKRAI